MLYSSLTTKSVYDSSFLDREGEGGVFGKKHLIKASPAAAAHVPVYATWQYAAYKIIESRLWRHPARTKDPSRAKVFFIPYGTV